MSIDLQEETETGYSPPIAIRRASGWSDTSNHDDVCILSSFARMRCGPLSRLDWLHAPAMSLQGIVIARLRLLPCCGPSWWVILMGRKFYLGNGEDRANGSWGNGECVVGKRAHGCGIRRHRF